MYTMHIFQDATVIVPVINIVNTIVNIYWSMRLKSVQGNTEIIRALREQVEENKDLIQELHDKKNRYKNQYIQLLTHTKELEGKLKTYEDIHRKIAAEP